MVLVETDAPFEGGKVYLYHSDKFAPDDRFADTALQIYLSKRPWIVTLQPANTQEGNNFRAQTLAPLMEEFNTNEIFPIAIFLPDGRILERTVVRDLLFVEPEVLEEKLKEHALIPVRQRALQSAWEALTGQEYPRQSRHQSSPSLLHLRK